MSTRHPLLDTVDEMILTQTPNLLRLYVNPLVAQACLCLARYVEDTWHADAAVPPEHQSFLANSFDEALSGAIKLARFCAAADGRPKAGLVLDPEGRLGSLAAVTLEGQGTIAFIPELVVRKQLGPDDGDLGRFGFVVLFPSSSPAPEMLVEAVQTQREAAPLLIACVSRPALACCRQDPLMPWRRLWPDIVVFDESFVRKHVPFGAFTARKTLYDHWNKPGLWTFHSTTYQPNSISSLHFLRCLEEDDPAFLARVAPQLERVTRDRVYRKSVFARQYNASLARTTAAVGWDVPGVRAAGHYVHVNGRRVFDAVAGVACSIRGHNPLHYREEIERLSGVGDYHKAAAERLARLTGLGRLVPAVSGASAVENALRLGLAAQFPKTHVLAFTGGFGGKTLLALTGTANGSYKRGLDPLYENVAYVNPFGGSAVEDLEAALRQYPVGVVQLELIQAVGGVRAVPERVVRYLHEHKQRWGYLLFADEVQTGMYRTGPFLRSQELGIEPDLLTIGKGTSDMMFPFAVTLYSDAVHDRLVAHKTDLALALRQRCDYEFGYKTLINVLDRAAQAKVDERVRELGGLFAQQLAEGLSGCKAVRDVRVFGLLIAIELDTRRGPRKWLKKQAGSLYVMNLLRYKPFPLFVGYCQYEPHVLKITPPLSITREEVLEVCQTLQTVLRRPTYRLVPPLLGALAHSSVKARWEAYWNRRASRERVER
jgi:acetylornithine/succinyldiaminopimelate/putrescine aminotransferase